LFYFDIIIIETSFVLQLLQNKLCNVYKSCSLAPMWSSCVRKPLYPSVRFGDHITILYAYAGYRSRVAEVTTEGVTVASSLTAAALTVTTQEPTTSSASRNIARNNKRTQTPH